MEYIKVSQENAKALMELAIELAEEGNLAESIGKRLEGADAEKAAADIDAGIGKFDEMYEEAIQGDVKDVIISKFVQVLSDKPEEEKRELLSKLIIALGGQPDDLSTDGLILVAAEYIDNFAVMNIELGSGSAADALLAFGEEASNGLYELSLQGRSRRYVAAALYILRERGELPEVSDELDAEEIGVYTAATVATDRFIREGAAGRIPWEKVKAVIKLIAAVAAAVVAVIVISKAAALLTLAIIVTIPTLWIGLGPIHALVATGLVCLATKLVSKAKGIATKTKEFAAPGIAVVAELFNKLATWIREKVAPGVAGFWRNAKEKASAINEMANERVSAVVENEDVEDEEEGVRVKGDTVLA
jgi:hypothetical protein